MRDRPQAYHEKLQSEPLKKATSFNVFFSSPLGQPLGVPPQGSHCTRRDVYVGGGPSCGTVVHSPIVRLHCSKQQASKCRACSGPFLVLGHGVIYVLTGVRNAPPPGKSSERNQNHRNIGQIRNATVFHLEAKLHSSLKALSQYYSSDWLLGTSPNGIDFSFFRSLSLSLSLLHSLSLSLSLALSLTVVSGASRGVSTGGKYPFLYYVSMYAGD